MADHAHDPDMQLFIDYAMSGALPQPHGDLTPGDEPQDDHASRDEGAENVDSEVLRDENNESLSNTSPGMIC